jgi:hypothetical protein
MSSDLPHKRDCVYPFDWAITSQGKRAAFPIEELVKYVNIMPIALRERSVRL